MSTIALSQLLMLLTWFLLAALLLLIIFMARFYERFAGDVTGYRWFALPLLGFGAAAIRYASIDRIQGDLLADLLLGTSGLILMSLMLYLYRQMTREKRT